MVLQSIIQQQFLSGEVYYLVSNDGISVPIEDINEVYADAPLPFEL